ncbi:MAG: phosphatase PAP2 family protein [Candidatus Velthaea sp.]
MRAAGPAAVFAGASVAYVWLGDAVSHAPPGGLDAAARAATGEAPGAAWVFTESCLWPVLALFAVAGIAVAALIPAWRPRIAFSIATTLVSWQSSNVLKEVFRRARPEYWIVHHETSFSYSSGHAMFAVLVFWLWAYFVLRSELPARFRGLLAAPLGAWGAGVIWSRLALGAHYPTDLAGGVLLAAAMLSLATLVLFALPRGAAERVWTAPAGGGAVRG